MIASALLLASALVSSPQPPSPCRPALTVQQILPGPDSVGPGLSTPPCIPVTWQAHDVTGLPPLTLTWFVDGAPQALGDRWIMDTALYAQGFHTVTFQAENAWGSASHQSFIIIEGLSVPPIEAVANPTTSQTVTVYASGAMEGATQWRIAWGDGTGTPWSCDFSDPTHRTSHTYAQPGTYWVRLEGRNCREGPLSGPLLPVTVGSAEAIQITRFEVQGCIAGFCSFEVGELLVFDQAFSAVPTELRYDWDGDGQVDQVSASPVGNHRYLAAGVFRPALTAIRGAAQDHRVHEEFLLIQGGGGTLIFEDGFETGDLTRWSAHEP